VGAIKTLTTFKNPVISGLENVMIAAAGAALAYGIGLLYGTYA
jgi:VIT1/CCC1 family predicted Fe2+/Mn2+ transporter